MADPSPNADIAAFSFEAALKELEAIVDKLERGEVELEQSIAIYERGAALRAHCEKTLKDAELKVEEIVLNEQGRAQLKPSALDPGADEGDPR